MDKSANHVTLSSPVDLYGINARKLHLALSQLGGTLTIEKAMENRTCPASSLLGILRLGVRKGDEIRIFSGENVDDFSRVVNVFSKIAC